MKHFSETLNYTSSNEDGRSEGTALRIDGTSTVLCITGSGARPLDLLTYGPQRIVSIDLNPCQSHLLHLKLAAVRVLSYDEFLAFVGVQASAHRVALYRSIRHAVPNAARRYWDAREDVLARGVLYAGRWERHFRMLALIVGALWHTRRHRLFACTTVHEQAAHWRRTWHSDPAWRIFLRCATAPVVWTRLLADPGFYRFVPPAFDATGYLRGCFDRASSSFLFRESAFARLLFFGTYTPGGPLPLHLQRAHYPALQAHAARVRVVTGSVDDYLATTSDHFSAFSLSDIASYTDEAAYARLWRGVARSARREARVCERQFLVKRSPPCGVLVREPELEARLGRRDHSMFYTFITGRLAPKHP